MGTASVYMLKDSQKGLDSQRMDPDSGDEF